MGPHPWPSKVGIHLSEKNGNTLLSILQEKDKDTSLAKKGWKGPFATSKRSIVQEAKCKKMAKAIAILDSFLYV